MIYPCRFLIWLLHNYPFLTYSAARLGKKITVFMYKKLIFVYLFRTINFTTETPLTDNM